MTFKCKRQISDFSSWNSQSRHWPCVYWVNTGDSEMNVALSPGIQGPAPHEAGPSSWWFRRAPGQRKVHFSSKQLRWEVGVDDGFYSRGQEGEVIRIWRLHGNKIPSFYQFLQANRQLSISWTVLSTGQTLDLTICLMSRADDLADHCVYVCVCTCACVHKCVLEFACVCAYECVCMVCVSMCACAWILHPPESHMLQLVSSKFDIFDPSLLFESGGSHKWLRWIPCAVHGPSWSMIPVQGMVTPTEDWGECPGVLQGWITYSFWDPTLWHLAMGTSQIK